jgi:hypothetical protein
MQTDGVFSEVGIKALYKQYKLMAVFSMLIHVTSSITAVFIMLEKEQIHEMNTEEHRQLAGPAA